MTGEEARSRLRSTVAGGGVIIGAGAGTGLSAKCAQDGGADLIIIYNSGRYRMAGRGSLAGLMPYGDANAIVLEMAAEVLPVVRETPVLAGVCGTDPFRLMDRFLRQIEDAGFAGVQNFPTVGLIDGVFRANVEETGMSYAQEVEMIGLAHERGLLTTPYVFDVESAEALAEFWHKRMRQELGFGSDDDASVKKLFQQKYRGSRYSFGYPACPNLEDRALLVKLLEPRLIGVTLNENFMLVPEQSTDAIVVHHPQAKYFDV